MNKIKEELLSALSRSLGIDNIDLEVPSNHELGDYSLHCYKIAKRLGKEPKEIANTVIKLSESLSIIKEVRHIGHYINFFVEKNLLAKLTLEQIWRENDIYGSSNIGMNKSVSIEHTSINPNASPHVGRARNAIIGDSIVRILRFQGYNVETHYFVNDVGKQIAMLVFGCNGKEVNFKELLKIYVEINKKIEENKELEKEVLNIIRKLEKGDKVIKSEFKRVVKVCVNGQRKILSELGIRYDYFDYESKYLWSKDIKSILDKLNRTGKLFVDNEGRYVLNEEGYSLAMKSPVLVLTRGDKTSLYPLRDIAYTIEKSLKGFDRNIVVLGEDQKLYYQQIKIALSFLGYKTPEVVHYSFVLLQDTYENSPTKMSTRSGNIVLLEELMNESVEKAKLEVKKRGLVSEREIVRRAKVIGYGAIKYGILKVSPEKNVIFDIVRALSFDGDTSPYIQYAYARICSILRKYKKDIRHDVEIMLSNHYEFVLVSTLSEFPEIVKTATDLLKPNIIANYLYTLAQSFNEFYHNYSVLNTDDKTMESRIVLISAIKQVLRNGLGLLGIETLERM